MQGMSKLFKKVFPSERPRLARRSRLYNAKSGIWKCNLKRTAQLWPFVWWPVCKESGCESALVVRAPKPFTERAMQFNFDAAPKLQSNLTFTQSLDPSAKEEGRLEVIGHSDRPK